jgi:hypothetical protein
MQSSPGTDLGLGLVEKGLSMQALSFVNFRLLAGICESGMQSSPGTDLGLGLVEKGLSMQALSFVNFRLLTGIGES